MATGHPRSLFVGKATADKLQGIGIHTIGQLAESDRHTVTALLGKQGSIIHDYANGLDQTPVSRFDEREDVKSIGNGSTFRRNLKGIQDIRTAVIALSDTVAVRLRQKKKKAFGVKVDIKDPSLKVISRQQQLDNPTNLAENIADAAVSIIEKSWNLRRPHPNAYCYSHQSVPGRPGAAAFPFFQRKHPE